MNQKVSNVKNNSVLSALFMVNFCVTISLSVFDSFLPLYLTNIGLTGIMFGVTVAAYAVAKMLLAPVLNANIGSLSKKYILITCIFLFICVSLVSYFSTSMLMLVFARIMQGVSAALFRPVLVRVLRDYLNEERRASMLGTFDISFYAGIGAGPFLGGIAHDHYGFKGVLILLMILFQLSIIILWFIVPNENRDDKSQRNITHKVGIFSNNKIVSLFIFIFGRGYIIATSCSFLQILLMKNHGMTASETGLVMTCSSLAMILFLRRAGRLADNLSAINLILVGGIIVSTLYCIVPIISALHSFILLYIFIGLFSIISQPAATLTMINETCNENTCVAISYFNSFMGFGVTCGILFGSFIMKMFGLNAVFITAAFVSGITVIISWLVYCINFEEMLIIYSNPDREH